MLDFFGKAVKKLFGTKYDRDVAKYSPIVIQINEFYTQYNSLSNDDLRNKTLEFKSRIKEHLKGIDSDIQNLSDQVKTEKEIFRKEELFKEIDDLTKDRDKHLEDILEEILPEAFAVMKETSRRFMENESLQVTTTDFDRKLFKDNRSYITVNGEQTTWRNSWKAAGGDITWNMVHYDVQLIGGMVLHEGKIAEMQTGEGKTLVATLPVYLNGLSGNGVHLITVNDYLARRDSEWVGPIFEFLMLSVDCIDKYQPHSPERTKAYQSDVVYGTNNEFGFDYLRDNMVTSLTDKVQQKHHYAIIDEVDSVLIDDARTPLIISGPVQSGSDTEEFNALKHPVEKLLQAQKAVASKYLSEAKKLFADNILGNGEGEAGLALLRAHRALPKSSALIKFLSQEGVKVQLQKAENFYMQENSKHMHIADDPLYFTIDEKNRQVELIERGADFLSKGREEKDFFIMPNLGEETMSIEANESLSKEEKIEAKNTLIHDFALKSKRLHILHQLLKAYTLFTIDEDYVVMNEEVKIVDEQTGRMMEGRRYSDGLHQALEAKENVKIGDLTQTYATVTLQNYFRMYHKLSGMTGTAETEASELWDIYKLDVVVIPTNRPIIRNDQEDLIYKTAREKYDAVIFDIVQLSQAKRPVLVGTTSVDISEKLSKMLHERGIKHNVLNAKQHQREAEVVAEAGNPGQVTIATNMAGRGTDIKISDEVKAVGGLAIIGTERHDSRRVDRQLRGRAGRQGDPGSSQFYVSLEDNLMRLFQSERIAKMMDKMGHKEGEVIQHSMVSKSIERAQKKVEENNFGIRKRLLEYDDVMNIQREAIYAKRNNALKGDRLEVDLKYLFENMTENIFIGNKQANDYQGFQNDSRFILGIEPDISENDFLTLKESENHAKFHNQVITNYKNKSEKIVEALFPGVKNVYETQGERYTRISIPYTDGSERPLPIAAVLKDAVESNGQTIIKDIEKTVSLALIDDNWKEHLRGMDELKDSVQAASFEQKDPLVVYKMEAYELFERLIYQINESISSYLLNGKLIAQEKQPIQEATLQKVDLSKMRSTRAREEDIRSKQAAANAGQRREKPVTFKREASKVGRNAPCPCGSGKKFKNCHGKLS